MDERRIHRIFEISVLLKGAHAVVESIGGVFLYLVSTEWIVDIVNRITQEELLEHPNDFVAAWLARAAQDFSVSSKSFYAFYLLSHGIVKLWLVVGLLRGQLWAYPASLVVLVLFIAYQVYRFSYTYSVGLLLLTVFDVFVIVLIWHEWRLVQRLHHSRA